MTGEELRARLARIDGRGYKAYGDLRGTYRLEGLTLFVDRVQGDPFAAPSRLRLRVPMDVAALPRDLIGEKTRRVALADFLARCFEAAAGGRRRQPAELDSGRARRGSRGSGKSGLVSIDAGGQEVLERTALKIDSEWVEARIEVGLPAAGRRVLGREAEHLLLERLPALAAASLHWGALDAAAARLHVETVENQATLREQLGLHGLIAFVADGSVLPRRSGASEAPLARERVVPFETPESLRVALPLAHPVDRGDGPRDHITGMGIPRGITLIVGGGYHGKSTLLRALECAVHPHVPGDGREYVVASHGLVKIRAEDGRAVTGVDIHGFIDDLPRSPGVSEETALESTRSFTTEDASGSTSQAAAIVEAIEVGASGLLLDEDTSATNFMVRDARMQRLVHRDHEPITPFVDRVRALYDDFGVSTILVMGGSGDYFDVADTVVRMRDYRAEDATAEAKAIADAHPTGREETPPAPLEPIAERYPAAASCAARSGRRDVKISAKGRELVLYGNERLDLRHVTQLLDTSQTRAAAMAIHLAHARFMSGADGADPEATALADVLDAVEALVDREGLDVLDPDRHFGARPDAERHPGAFARPRRFEIAAALNRLRTLRVVPPEQD